MRECENAKKAGMPSAVGHYTAFHCCRDPARRDSLPLVVWFVVVGTLKPLSRWSGVFNGWLIGILIFQVGKIDSGYIIGWIVKLEQ